VGVVGQRGVGQRVAVQIINEAEQQFVGGIEVQKVRGAGLTVQKLHPQRTYMSRQAALESIQLLGQQGCVFIGQRATSVGVEQLRKYFQLGLDGRHHVYHTTAAQTCEQLVQGIEACGDGHEFTVQTAQAATATTHVRVFKHRHAAHAFQPYALTNKAHVAGFIGLLSGLAAQAFGNKTGKHTKAFVQRVMHGRACGFGQNRGTDYRGAEDAQGDFQHPPHSGHKGPIGMRQRGQTDHGGGVTGENETISTKVTAARRTGRADTHPNRQRAQEQHRVLRKQGNQRDHHRRTGQGTQKSVKTFGKHLATLRLHHDKHCDHRRARLRQLKTHGQPQGQKGRDQNFEDMHPGHAIAACPVKEATAPFQGIQPAYRGGQVVHLPDLKISHQGFSD